MTEHLQFFDEAALLDRLSYALKIRDQETVFVFGSALSSPIDATSLGVPGVDGMIDLIRSEFTGGKAQLEEFDRTMANTKDCKYQTAFRFLQGRLGQSAANDVVKKAVLLARRSNQFRTATDDNLRMLDLDSDWELNPGTSCIGTLITRYPARFGTTVLTTNFDPLIEVGIRRAGGNLFKTMLHSDGSLSQTEGAGCHVVHLHGYWYGSDTLHTNRQLLQPRPKLKGSLTSLLRNRLVVVCGYGGWDDVFTNALIEVVQDDSALPEILWCFYPDKPAPSESLLQQLGPGLSRGRVSLYSGINCNVLFPKLLDAWQNIEASTVSFTVTQTNPVHVTETIPSVPTSLRQV